jgi:hypothetical protein
LIFHVGQAGRGYWAGEYEALRVNEHVVLH